MANEKFDKQQINDMIDMLAGGAADKSKLKNAVDDGRLDKVLGSLKPGDAAKVQSILADKEAAEKILKSPAAQMLLRRFNEGKK